MATIKNKFAAILAFFGWASVEATADGIFFSEEQLGNLDTELTSLQTQVKEKDAEIATQKDKVTAAETKVVAAEKQVTDLTAQVTTLTNEKKEVQDKLDKATGVTTTSKTEDKITTGNEKKVVGVTAEAQQIWEAAKAKQQKS